MRLVYFGTYREEYARNRIVMEGLRCNGIEVVECHARLWRSEADRLRTAEGGWLRPAFIWRALTAYARLVWRYRQVGDYDVLMVGYPGHYDVFLARLLAWLRHKPLAWDVFNSLYLILLDRGIAQRRRLTAALVRGLERAAVHQPEMMFLDTPLFVEWFCHTYGVPAERFRILPIGADDRVFTTGPQIPVPASGAEPFRVLYYGTYIPNHGLSVIVEAARRLQDQADIHFELIGQGPERAQTEKLARQYGLHQVTFVDWLDQPALVRRILEADVCLGTFGDTRQAGLTYNNKIHEAFALHRPVISAETPAAPESIRHGEHLYTCRRGDPQALAEAILALKDNPELRQRLAENGYRLFHAQFNIRHIGAMAVSYLHELASAQRRPARQA